jgi:hypothetical protein
MYIKYEFNKWWKYHFATITWKISQHIESFVVSIIIGQLLHFFRNGCIKSGSLRFSQFSVVDWFCLFIYLWVLTLLLEDCSEFGNFVITLIYRISVSQMTIDMFILSWTQSRPSTLLFTYIRFCDVDHC